MYQYRGYQAAKDAAAAMSNQPHNLNKPIYINWVENRCYELNSQPEVEYQEYYMNGQVIYPDIK